MTNPPLPILDIRGLSKQFEVNGASVDALAKVELVVQKGEFVCLIGASGCGKSTLLRIIAGFEKPTTGTVTMYGAPVTGPGADRGVVFQDYALFPWLTVIDNIAFGPHHRGLSKEHARKAAEKYMEIVGLSAYAERFPAQLSGGMKQRVAIARVLANDADMLLMDEPFGALDALTREKLQEDLLEIWQRTGLTIIFVTHSVEEAVLLSDRVVVMSASPGRIASDNPLPLARPRDVSAVDFNEVRRRLTLKLTSHVMRSVVEA
ncbi:MAG: ABC transporter ATP-binding protein [Herminiimonas sp.]|nr:ABC transporter ATP-binding protein [Herminiimonas sp.]